jgi:hypothetical protein
MLSLRCRRGDGALAELLARRLTSPGTRINITYCTQPLLRLSERGEVPHVQPEPLAPFLEATAHEETEALELGLLGIRQRHRRRRRA